MSETGAEGGGMAQFIRKGIASAVIALSGLTGMSVLGSFNTASSAPAATVNANCASHQRVYFPPPPAEETGANIGPITPLKMECQNTLYQDDLDASIPGTGIALGGDSVPGYPQIHLPGVYDGDNPLSVPNNTRPLPTGTAIGPHGEHYAFYSIVPYKPGGGYTSPNTVVVDLAHPETPLFTLHGISQASGAYDPKTDRMVILGNTKSKHRALWQSAPIGKNGAWGNTLRPLGTFSGAMDGSRESQIVALPKDGFLVVGADAASPIQAVTASTPKGLLTAAATELVTQQTLPQVYGPTITNIQETNGKQVVTMRVSTYGIGHYDPHTYTTTFTIRTPSPLKNAADATARKSGGAAKDQRLMGQQTGQ